MRYLAFERRYELEAVRCDRCAGSGIAARPTPRHSWECWYCRGLGRRVTARGRAVFSEICEALGKEVLARESRIDPKHLETILARDIRPGMMVGDLLLRIPLRLVTQVEQLSGACRLTFLDGGPEAPSNLRTYLRELTEEEIVRVEQLMRERLGAGAVEASPRGTDATAQAPG